jgi:hypothetical protein
VKPGQTPTAGSAGALSAIEDLRRSAAWTQLSDADRASLLSVFTPFPAGAAASGGDAASASATSVALQEWVAGLVTPALQVEAAQIIRGWLEDATPAAHLFIGGAYGQGRTSLVATLARQVMAKRPSTVDYCYVPDTTALDQAYLLTLPLGLGKDFAGAIDRALRMLTSAWNADTSDDDDNNNQQPANAQANGAQANGAQANGQRPPTKSDIVAAAFGDLDAAKFNPVRDYLTKLRTTFEAFAAANMDLSVSYDDLATWLVKGTRGQNSAQDQWEGNPGAPVVVGSLVRDKLDDLLIRANGGVLIMQASDVLGVDGAWPALSVALASQTLSIKSTWPPLPLTARVALVGDGPTYNALANASGGFTSIFRYETWINGSISWTPRAEATYAALADGATRYNNLPLFDPSGVAKLVEEGARRGDGMNRGFLIADLVTLRDIAVDAGRQALARSASATSGADVITAMQRRRRLQGATAQRVREAILSGQANTPTTGSAIGQINGLGVYEFHPPEGNFAVPTRISATVSAGKDERLLDIEREADQADADHVRGEMTIEGYLANRYGQTRPLHLVARIRFEQEHGTTGGDSASGAILFALLSALSQIPIQFSRAVTGAVGQYGELQPIGGVNTKIEGFWTLCRSRRAQGEQSPNGYGVIIPTVNSRDLMLPDEVAEAIINEGWFHIWPVSTVDEALAILTGHPVNELHARVEKRLQQFYQAGAQGGR